MKADSIIILVLAFSLITIAVGGIIGDMNNNYDVQSNTSAYSKYNYADEINKSTSKIQNTLEHVGDEKGYLQVLSGASAILQATPQVVLMILSVPIYVIGIIRGISLDIGIPPAISYIFIIMIFVSLIFMGWRAARGEVV